MPVHISDLTKPKYEVLIELINADNDTNYSVDDLMFDHPVMTGDADRNTSISITGVNPPYVVGDVTVRYNRPDIQSLPGASRLAFFIGGKERYSDFIEMINAILGTCLEEGDYVDEPLPSFAGAPRGTSTYRDLYMTENNPVLSGKVRVLFHN